MNGGVSNPGEHEAIVKQEWREETEKWADPVRRFLVDYQKTRSRYNDRVDFSSPGVALSDFLYHNGVPDRILVMYEDGQPVRMTIKVSSSEVHIWGDAMEGLLKSIETGEQETQGM